MKAYPEIKRYSLAILSILFLFLAGSCSLTRRLSDNQALVRKVQLDSVDEAFSEQALTFIDRQQQPNNWFNLQLYYLFSKKGKKNIGEPPAILDSGLVEYSRVQIEQFLENKGYLKAKVTSEIQVAKKKAKLRFIANQGPLFRIRSFQDSIGDPAVRALYRVNRRRFSHVQPGSRFDKDSLAFDRDEFYQVMKRNGYYDFYRQYVNYNYDSTFNNSVVDLKMIVDNPFGKDAHPTYKINNTLVTITNSNGRTPGKADTLRVDSQFTFVDYSHRFSPKAITRYIFQKKGDLYNLDQQSLTTSRLSELNVFRNVPSPTYRKLPDSTNRRLDNQINLIPLKRMSDRLEAEFLFNSGRYGYNLGNTFTNRNIFKHAEILQLKLNWSVLFANSSNGSGGIQNQDFRAGVNLVYPRIIAPFDLPVMGKYGVPHTTFSSNFQLFFQKDLVSRRSFINSLTYDWIETARKQHVLTPINIEFSSGSIDPLVRRQLIDSNRYSYVFLIGRTVFSSGSQYTYQLNANKLNSFENFTYFRGFLDLGGNTLNLLSRLTGAPRDTVRSQSPVSNVSEPYYRLSRTMFGYIFAQYAKFDVDLRFYRNVGVNEKQFIFRINPGIGIPYGNSDQLIYEKNYYAGGANDMRAWLPRTLGPGNFNRQKFYGSDSISLNRFRYLDQFGEIRIVGNAEYRFKIANNFYGAKLKGAFFTDFGNVWRLHKMADNPGGEFKFNKLWSSAAMDIGAGLRFDLSYFVFRLDAGLKFKDPQFTGSDQWVLIKHFDELFSAGAFKDNYRATYYEPYRFMQLNFGIGLPF